jgi:hypothetical protein
MSYIYSGSAIYQANGKPVVDPRGASDGLYPILGAYSTATNNTVFTLISPGATGGSYVMTHPIGSGGSGVLGAGIEEPISGWNSLIDYGFGTTQYYRDGALYGSGTTLQRNDIMQSVLASRRIFGIGFTQSGLNSLNLGRNIASSIYATQEYIVYFSDQLGTVPRTTLEGNINSYYQVSNLPDYTSGLLADYSGAAAAYSVRALSNTAIKCMRVRRTVAPFDEQDIGFDSNGDLDTAAISTFGGSDALTVSVWYDQSGQSRHAVQNTPGSQPSIYDGAAVITENGKAILSGGFLQYSTITYTNSVHSTFYICRFDANAIYASGSGSNTGQYQAVHRGGVIFERIGGLTTYHPTASTATTNAQHLISILDDATTTTSSVDGTSGTVSSAGTWTAGVTLTHRGEYGLSPDVKIQELVIYDSDQSSNRTGIESNINTYYSIY